jgi:hypothetical protein
MGTVEKTNAEVLRNIEDSKTMLAQRAVENGILLSESYLSVLGAAKELGDGLAFKTMNKALSKFAHPTAVEIMLPIRPIEEIRSVRDGFVILGAGFTIHAFESVEKLLQAEKLLRQSDDAQRET